MIWSLTFLRKKKVELVFVFHLISFSLVCWCG